jgi:hypothetical protein
MSASHDAFGVAMVREDGEIIEASASLTRLLGVCVGGWVGYLCVWWGGMGHACACVTSRVNCVVYSVVASPLLPFCVCVCVCVGRGAGEYCVYICGV